MKEAGYNHWISPNTNATNTSLFNGLPGGERLSYNNINGHVGECNFIGLTGYWWTSTEYNKTLANMRNLNNSDSNANSGGFGNKSTGFSVRCIKD